MLDITNCLLNEWYFFIHFFSSSFVYFRKYKTRLECFNFYGYNSFIQDIFAFLQSFSSIMSACIWDVSMYALTKVHPNSWSVAQSAQQKTEEKTSPKDILRLKPLKRLETMFLLAFSSAHFALKAKSSDCHFKFSNTKFFSDRNQQIVRVASLNRASTIQA